MTIVASSSVFERLARTVVAGMLVSAAALCASPAHASPEYPGELRKVAGLSCVPQCTVCHTTNPGQAGTAVQPFAIAMRSKGLLAGNPGLIKPSYEALKTDTAHPEYLEMTQKLESGYDPNYDVALGQLVCGPTYGCGARIAKAPPKHPDAFAWALGAVALLVTVRTVKPKRRR